MQFRHDDQKYQMKDNSNHHSAANLKACMMHHLRAFAVTEGSFRGMRSTPGIVGCRRDRLSAKGNYHLAALILCFPCSKKRHEGHTMQAASRDLPLEALKVLVVLSGHVPQLGDVGV